LRSRQTPKSSPVSNPRASTPPPWCDHTATLTGAVVTADALYTQRNHADYLVLQCGAHYLLKENFAGAVPPAGCARSVERQRVAD
jgi:hypothetical protein